ncbi:MAG: NUDIX hydrolase [Verrucomicrobia bacterium]|nr:NUDIX hydrolase [Verrucomicrobiota bacterium]
MKKYLIALLLSFASFENPLIAQMVYEEVPENFQPKIEVAACFIRSGDKVLFMKRLPYKPQGNTWGIPGGKFDKGETPQQTVIREIREETGIEMPTDELCYFGKVFVRYPEMDYTFHLFEYRTEDIPDVEYNPGEHAGYTWVTFEEALKLPLIPGEEECISLVYGGIPSSKIQETS